MGVLGRTVTVFVASTMIFDHEYDRRLEQDLEGILLELRDVIPASKTSFVREFMGAGEYGLAIETLCAVIVESGYMIPQTAYERIVEVANRMHVEPTSATCLTSNAS